MAHDLFAFEWKDKRRKNITKSTSSQLYCLAVLVLLPPRPYHSFRISRSRIFHSAQRAPNSNLHDIIEFRCSAHSQWMEVRLPLLLLFINVANLESFSLRAKQELCSAPSGNCMCFLWFIRSARNTPIIAASFCSGWRKIVSPFKRETFDYYYYGGLWLRLNLRKRRQLYECRFTIISIPPSPWCRIQCVQRLH